ncbi:hypothetical protein AQUSIP_15820 [Aquicella siphonis]|uniref:Methyltransferase domain-containing protein n=1 Tax=Aquicella siphonis TaxID=254247 RepID=A0A5E4PIN3_9COXI|nr:class I SAM-dependent methyltransferase [Aquicella siphonis]VVC76273.1 hypothetical protein AQUSIP_15820 [Aquicella siphonis]
MSYMLTEDEEDIAQEWQKYKGYTIRPLPSTLEFYDYVIKCAKRDAKNLLFGATPEIRSIFQRLERKVVMVDNSLSMVRAMGRLTIQQQAVSSNETFIPLDWLNLGFLDETFDFAIGDDAINMIGWDYFDAFLRNTAAALNPQGIFVCHLLLKPDDSLIDKTVDEVFTDYTRGLINNRHDLASMLNFICYDKSTWSMGWQQTINRIGREKLLAMAAELDFIGTFGKCNSRFCCPPRVEFETLVRRYFEISDCFFPQEYAYCAFEPVYVLAKNGR